MNRTGYDAALLGEFLGERKLANLRKLIAQARALDRSGVLSLSDFIVQLSQFIVRQPREPLAATHPESTDVVRLMTIHQSKGLEFPVVFVPDIGRRLNDRATKADYSDELGPLVRLPKDHECAGALDGHSLHRLATSVEDKAEALRLFYVAATRAADFLILSGGLKKLDAENGPWMELLSERFDVASGRCIASLPRDHGAPRVRVLMAPPTVDIKRLAAHTRVDLDRIVREIEQAAAEDDCRALLSAEPIPCDLSARRRFSVSRLTGTLDEAPTEGDAPRIRPVGGQASPTAGQTDALELGLLVHAALVTLELQHKSDLESLVVLQADKLQVRNTATSEEALRLLKQYVGSPRANLLRQAQRTFREIEFLLAWPPVGVQSSACSAAAPPPRPTRYLQGYLDCLFQDAAGRWHVVDYKTNHVSPDALPQLIANYEMQMLAYGLAAEQSLREPIASLTLHFLRTSEERTFEWNDEVRKHAIDLINNAITAATSPH
jgi:ATP-dependent helicase/nuclease subunit A